MNKRWPIILSFIFFLFLGLLICVPKPLFNSPFSTVVNSSEGKLLGARIAADQQWRFPAVDSIPVKYKKCLLHFEDRYFYYHPGINLVSLSRAFFQNIKEKKIVSGGSTITMQICRMARGQTRRSIKNFKIICFSCPFWWKCCWNRCCCLALFLTTIIRIVLGRIGNSGCFAKCTFINLSRAARSEIKTKTRSTS